MVMPTPFERMLQRAQELAQRDPQAAFAHMDELYGKSLTDLDVRHLGALAAHIGGAVLGAWDEAIAFVERCLGHPALESGEESERSLRRALCVLHTCAGHGDEATDAFAAGIRNTEDHARVAIMCAQTLVANKQFQQAREHLQTAAELCATIHPEQDVIDQVATVAANIARHAEALLLVGRGLLEDASTTAYAACTRMPDWRLRHKALYQQARTLLLNGKTVQALSLVQRLMALEDEQQAGASERFYTANLACRAQLQRGQLKIAAKAYAACQSLAQAAANSGDPDHDKIADAMAKLTADLEADRADRHRFDA